MREKSTVGMNINEMLKLAQDQLKLVDEETDRILGELIKSSERLGSDATTTFLMCRIAVVVSRGVEAYGKTNPLAVAASKAAAVMWDDEKIRQSEGQAS